MSTDLIKKGVLQSLNVETRYTSLFGFEEKQDNLSYVLGARPTVHRKTSNASLKSISRTSQSSDEQSLEKETYFTLLKEDKLEMLEIYLNLKRQLLEFIETGHYASNLSGNISLMLNFEKWSGNLSFSHLIKRQLKSINEVMLYLMIQGLLLNKSDFVKYLNNPLAVNVYDNNYKFYKWLNLKSIPSAKNIRQIVHSAKKIKQNNP